MSVPSPAARPWHPDVIYGVRPFAAVGAGLAAGVVLLLLYYVTLAALPLATSYPTTTFPVSAWAHRLDMAQWLGAFAFPPTPTAFTWGVGIAVWLGTLTAMGVVYAILLSWARQASDAGKGAGFGVALAVALVGLLSLSQAFHPATMRNALPDPGVLLLGWSGWALVQLMFVYAVYGAVLGALYRRLSRS